MGHFRQRQPVHPRRMGLGQPGLKQEKSGLLGSPLGRGVRLHRQRMHFIGMHLLAQRGIDQLVALDQALALEGRRHDRRKPVAAIAFERAMLSLVRF